MIAAKKNGETRGTAPIFIYTCSATDFGNANAGWRPKMFYRVQLEVGLNKSSAESAEQQSPGRKPWDQA
jgi:hypothetical protein